jgi:hypothetical protein
MSESDDISERLHAVGDQVAAAPASDAAESPPASVAPPLPAVQGGPSVPPPLPATAQEPDPAPAFVNAARGQLPRPLFGPSLWVSGVLLWAYVVMGIFTTTRLPFTANRVPLPEEMAFVLVVAAYACAGVLAVQRSLVMADGESGRRAGGIAAGAIGFWILFVFVAMVLAVLGFPEGLVSFILVLWSAFAVVYGRRLTDRGTLPNPNRNRVVTFGLWIGAAVVSLVALLSRA